MKKLLCAIPLFVMFLFSCAKITRLLTFEISSSDNIKIPPAGLISAPVISPVPVTVSSQNSFENNHTNANLVKDVRLGKLTLTIIDPATENFDFLQSVKISIGTNQNDKVPLASLSNIPTGVTSIALVSGNAPLDKFIKAASYTLYTEVSLRAVVSQELTVRADSKFEVTADPL